jgi:hypothetical protein
MLTELHNVHQRWAINAMVEWRGNSLLSFYESLLLQGGAGTSMYHSCLLDYHALIHLSFHWIYWNLPTLFQRTRLLLQGR